MLERVDAEAVAVGERDPVLVALGQVAQHAGVAQRKIPQREEVRPFVLGVWVVEAAGAKVAFSGACVAGGVLELGGPDTLLAGAHRAADLLATRAEP